MIFTPRPYQELLYDHVLNHPRCAVWAGMGMGKTSGSLLTVTGLKLLGNTRTLILAPKRVAQSTWTDEVTKWSTFKGISVSAIVGSPAQRLKALSLDTDVHTINYDNLPWLIETVGDNWRWRNIIADESTRLKSFRTRQGGKRAAALGKIAFSKIERFVELTGTPAPNGLLDLWGQLWFLDKGERLGRSFTAFSRRWFRPKFPNSFDLVPYPGAEKEITERVKDLCLSIRPEDYFNLEAPIVVDVPVHLPPVAMKLYKQMEKEFFIEIKEKGIEATNPASKSIKCLQIANGAIYTEDGWEPLHEAKFEALDDIIEEAAGMPILCAYHFKTDLIRLKKRYPYGRELDSSPKTIQRWNKGEIPLMFAHPASAGHGLNLQDGGNIVVMFGHWWDLELYLQILERIGPMRQLQAGHNRPVFIYNIRAVDTIDETVIQRRTDKRTVHELLLEAATRKHD